jgi:hypothetical protein
MHIHRHLVRKGKIKFLALGCRRLPRVMSTGYLLHPAGSDRAEGQGLGNQERKVGQESSENIRHI